MGLAVNRGRHKRNSQVSKDSLSAYLKLTDAILLSANEVQKTLRIRIYLGKLPMNTTPEFMICIKINKTVSTT